MHDPKFEQEVQRRMHDLEFVPSESVWAGIQQGMAPHKRRRAIVLFWWLFPGSLLVVGSILFYRHLASTSGVAAVVPAVETGKPAGGAGNGGGAGIGVTPLGTGGAGSGIVAGGKGTGEIGDRVVAPRMRTDRVGDRLVIGEERIVGEERTGVAGSQVVENRTEEGDERLAGSEVGGLIKGFGSRKGIGAPPLEWQPVKTAVSGIDRPRHPWAVGFAAGGGAASVFSGAGVALTTLSRSNANASYSPPTVYSNQTFSLSNISTVGGVKQNKVYIQPGYSYWAGVYGERQLSARWSVDVGLNLHYYSVRFETNGDVPVYPPSSLSLFTGTAFTYAANSPSAAVGGGIQTYYNHYYFLEVPAMVQWRINHNRSLPLFWRGGVVFSYLMGSNGLYFDNSTGNDEKDNGVVRHTQASIQSGLLVGLPVRGVQIQAGPEVQYGLNSMLTVGSGGGHLVYGGIRVALMR